MNNEQSIKMTDLDYMTASPHLQMIKAALPYIQVPEQKFFSVLVKVKELERTMELFSEKEEGAVGVCSLDKDESASPIDMLNAMKPFGSQEEQDFIDLVSNFLQGSRLYQSYRDSDEAKENVPNDFQHFPGFQGFSGFPDFLGSQNFSASQDLSSSQDLPPSQEFPGSPAMNAKGAPAASQEPNVCKENTFNEQPDFSEEEGASRSGTGGRRNDGRYFPLEQIKNILPPEQQSRLETAQILMQTFRQFS